MRCELSPAERSMHIAERKRLYEDLHGKAKAIGARAAHKAMGHDLDNATANSAVAFTKDVATKTGASERTVRQDASRGEKIENLAKVVRTSLDKGEELDALTKLKSNCLPTVS